MSDRTTGCYVIAHSTLEDMRATGYYDPSGKIVESKRLAAKFDQLTDTLGFVNIHRIMLDHQNFVSYVILPKSKK